MKGRLASVLTGLRLAVRGLWFRRSTALIALVLAVVATAASVVAPLYSHAAEESILRDTLRHTDAFSLGVHISRPQGDSVARTDSTQLAPSALAIARQFLTSPAFGSPQRSTATSGAYHPATGPNAKNEVDGRLLERDDICRHLPTTAGRCPERPGEGMLARRSLTLLGAKIGDTVAFELSELPPVTVGGRPPTLRLTIVGSYDPVPVDTAYWVGQTYFTDFFPVGRTKGFDYIPPLADPMFVGGGTAAAAGVSGYSIDVPVLTDRVQLRDIPVLQRQLKNVSVNLAAFQIAYTSQLPAALDQADAGRELVRIASPLAVAQLVLLAWWTLFLVVGSATEERSPELGLAKLRGLSQGQTGRFGLAEIMLLLVLAAPLGTLVGYLAVRAAGPHVFAPGTHVTLTSSVAWTVSIALSGGIVTAALAARQVFRRSVSDLLRRVPSRGSGRRGTLLEGIVIALAVAGIAQLVSDRGERPSPVALLAPGMVAVVGGLVAGRLLVSLARNRSTRAMERGRAARLIGWNGVARRPGSARIASVLAIATCLLLIGVEAWTVAERNRVERSSAEVGAAVVLEVRAVDSRALMTAVRKVDPSGDYAMAAVEVTDTNQQDAVLAVDSGRADRIMRWGAPDAKPARSIHSLVAPKVAPSLVVRPGRLEITATVTRIDSPSPLRLSVRLDDAGKAIRLSLGRLVRGERTYATDVPQECRAGCRLASFSVGHDISDLSSATAQLSVQRIAAGTGGDVHPLAAAFERPSSWRAGVESTGGAHVSLQPGTALTLDVSTPGGIDAEVVRGDAPEPLPAFAGAEAGLDPGETGAVPMVTAAGLSGADTHYRRVGRGPYVPRIGRAALLVDLDLALRQTDAAPEGVREVWLSRDDPAAERRLTRRLAGDQIRVVSRETAGAAERRYAGDGAVLALRLLLVCGAVAVVVSVGALLVAAYVGRRQRAYEVAALRVVGVPRRTVRAMLLRENLGTLLVSLVVGGVAALVATWVVLPSLPQFDNPSDTVPVRYVPDLAAGWQALAGLGLVLGGVGLTVAVLQLRAGRSDRLREGVR